jgi:hypothetical protein
MGPKSGRHRDAEKISRGPLGASTGSPDKRIANSSQSSGGSAGIISGANAFSVIKYACPGGTSPEMISGNAPKPAGPDSRSIGSFASHAA